jgi:DNA-binding LacI/PurR family transcriptional regulator
MLTKYLVEEGHKKIWHIAGAQNWFDGKLRVHGWRRALKEANLQKGSKMLVSSWSPHDAYRLILDTPMDPGPTAIFAASDHIAMATISALREKGLRVPEDISIVGYDDTQESVYISPSLTTIKQDLPLVSEQAMDLLMKRIAGKEIPLVTALKPKLIIRDSVRKLNK